MREKETFAESWKVALDTQKLLKQSDESMDAEFARLILHEDLGYLKKTWPTSYSLDEETRDRLIAHARQDAAHAVVNTTRLRKMAIDLTRTKRLTWISIALNIAVIWILLGR